MKTATRSISQKALKRRKLIGFSALALLLSLAILFALKPAQAQGYENISPPQNTSVSDKVEVLEFFWLGCPHCYALEPTIEKWLESKPDYVHFVREAPPLNPSWEAHSRGFYAAQLMGKENEFVHAMFEAIHEKKQPMRNPKKIAALAATIGLDEKKFLGAMKSFAVEGKLKRATDLAIKAGINSVPSVIINGKYRTSSSISGGHDGIVAAINDRAAAEKEAMKIQ